MALTPEQRDWLLEQKRELQRELDKLVADKARRGHVDKNERRLELPDELGEVERQLREGRVSDGETTAWRPTQFAQFGFAGLLAPL